MQNENIATYKNATSNREIHKKSATWKKVQREKITKKSATWKWRSKRKVQHEKNATRKKINCHSEIRKNAQE